MDVWVFKGSLGPRLDLFLWLDNYSCIVSTSFESLPFARNQASPALPWIIALSVPSRGALSGSQHCSKSHTFTMWQTILNSCPSVWVPWLLSLIFLPSTKQLFLCLLTSLSHLSLPHILLTFRSGEMFQDRCDSQIESKSFNCGVLVRRQDWEEGSGWGLQFLENNTRICKRYTQE